MMRCVSRKKGRALIGHVPARLWYRVRVLAVCVRCSRVHFLGITALMHAAGRGHTETVKTLLTKDGIKVDEKDVRGMKSGHFLVSCQYADRCSKRLR